MLKRAAQLLIFAAGLWAQSLTTVRNERPAGTPDGTLQFFTLKHKPASAWAVSLYVNGVHQEPGGDYMVVPNTNRLGFLVGSIPAAGDKLLADYDFVPSL